MANETITITQSLDQVTVVSEGPVGLNSGGTISGPLTVGVDGTGHDVKFFGDTAGKYMQWDQSADKLFVNGEIEVNGTATTFNSTVITIDDPIFTLGGQQRTDALDDSKDRGIEFFYHDGAQKTGFMGYDDSADAFTFLTSATNSNEVFSGTAATVQMGHLNFVEGSGGQIQFNGTEKINIGTNNIGLRKPIYGMVSTVDIGLSSNPFRDGYFSGAVTVGAGSAGSPSLTFSSDTDTGMYRSGADALAFSTGGTERVSIDSSGNVGIGTASPQEQLHLYGSSASKMEIESSGGGDASLKFQVAAQAWSAGIDNGDGDKFKINTGSNPGSAEMLAIDSSGNVGIGTASPAYVLDVEGNGGNAYVARICNEGNHENRDVLLLQGGDDSHLGTTRFITFADGNGTETAWIQGAVSGANGGVAINTTAAEAGNFVIDESGNVGIGTTSPAYELDVDGDIRVLDGHYIYAGDSTDLQIRHDGSNSKITNTTGDLYLINSADDKDIIFQSDDGSGDLETYFFLDGSTGYTQFPDNKRLALGSGDDLQIYHDALDSKIENSTGHLYITNFADDKDIIFQSDDGSGGVETYFFLDGSASSGNPFTVFPDNSLLAFGSGRDFILNHNGSNTNLGNYTGDIEIVNYANDKDIIFKTDDGSGGTAEYFRLDGSAAGSGNLFTIFPDSSYIGLGSNGTGDFIMAHNGTNTTFSNYTGNLQFTNNSDDGDIIFRCDDGSGGVETYFFLDGSANGGANPITIFPDNSILALGDSTDLMLWHNATNSYLQNFVGDLHIENYADDKDIFFRCDDGSGGLETYFFLDGSVGYSVAPKHVRFEDDIEAIFGADSDAKIRHSGSSLQMECNTGNWSLRQNATNADIRFYSDDGTGSATTEYFRVDGGTEQVVFSKALNYSTTLVNDSNYTTTRSDSVILFHSMSTYRYLTLASADCVAGRKIHVKNRDNSEYIYIQTEGSENIDGSSSIIGTQTARGSITLISDGSNWFILNKYST